MKKLLYMISPFNNSINIPKGFYILKKLLAFIMIFCLSAILAEGIIIVILLQLGYNINTGYLPPPETMFLMKLYGYVIFAFNTLLYIRLIEKQKVKASSFINNINGYLKGILIGFILVFISIGCLVVLGQIRFIGINNEINIYNLIVLLGAFIIQGSAEEILCRGFLLTTIAKRTGLKTAVLVSSLVFMAPHILSLTEGDIIYAITGIVNLLLISIILSLCILIENNIWIACALHSIWNYCLYSICGLSLSGTGTGYYSTVFCFSVKSENIINGGAYGIEASVITVFVLLLAVFGLLRYVKRKNINQKNILQKIRG